MDLKAEKRTLKSLLSVDEQQFRIPPYQRPYAWTSEQVDDLWQDLLDSVGSNHFLGSIVVATEDESRPQVIDGQQRLTTLMILMSVLRDQFHERGLVRNFQQLDKRFAADDLAEGDAYYKFRTGNANWPVFRDFILRSPVDSDRRTEADVAHLDPVVRERNKSLLDNWLRIRSSLEADLRDLPAASQEVRLVALQKALLEGVEIVLIQVKELGDAFLLFETLNDRGLQLSAADLLKSHLLGEIARKAGEEDVDAAAVEWDAMLEDLGPEVDVSRFLRHYLLVTLPKVKKDEIFGHFKKRVAAAGPTTVLKDLRASAKAYGEFEAPQRVQDAATRRVLTDLQTLRAMSCYIALLPARRHLSPQDFIEYARLAEVLTYRYSSVVGLGTNELERKYHEAAKLLEESQGARLAESRQVLLATMPDSEQFRVAFERLSMGRQYLLRYTLRRIEEHLSPSREKLVDTARLVHIEHIMPQRLSPTWISELGPQAAHHADYVDRWGNLTLLYSGLNIPASNKSFDEKKKYYADSQVRITKRLTGTSTWGIRQIEARQRWLAEIADQVWWVGAGGAASQPEKAPSAMSVFAQELGDLWEHVEPRCVETTAEEIRQLAELMPDHLAEHEHHLGHARELTLALETLLTDWEDLDGAERRVVAGAVNYYLDPDDAFPDADTSGLDDDRLVIVAAGHALGRTDLLS